VGFKNDFLEALRSVKRDFFRESEYTEKEQAPQQATEPEGLEAADTPSEIIPAFQDKDPHAARRKDNPFVNYPPPGAMKNSPGRAENTQRDDGGAIGADVRGDATPFMRQDESQAVFLSGDNGPESGRTYIDFEDSEVYDDSKTIISKNTIIRGALQTDDSVRLLGQMMGDIDCKANIVLAGKVRGNTSASNAYIYNAQVDGDVKCEDVITLSNDAWVLGNIRAQQAEIEGKIKGNMEIRHMVTIGATSSVLGDISTDELEIKRGAFVNGQIMMYSPSRDVLDRFARFGD